MNKWIEWIMELQSIAQNGITYAENIYDRERYERLRDIAAEMMSERTDIPLDKVKDLFCNESGYQTPKLETRAVIFKNDKILLVREIDGNWSIPGGWCDANQSVGSNTVKETKEETGLDVVPTRVIAIQDRKKHNTPPYAYGICKIYLMCDVLGGEFHENTETTEAKYFSIDEIPSNLATEKCTLEQIKMCFKAKDDKNWEVIVE